MFISVTIIKYIRWWLEILGLCHNKKALKNLFWAFTTSTFIPNFLNVLATFSGSFLLIKPLLIKTVFNRLPKALCPKIVTVELSTPPERTLMAFSLSTICLISFIFFINKFSRIPPPVRNFHNFLVNLPR